MKKKNSASKKSLCALLWLILGCVLVMGPVLQENILCNNLDCNVSADFTGATVPGMARYVEVPFSNTDDGSSGSGISIPASANVLDIHLLATTDFTSGGTPSIDIGFTGDKNELVAGIDIDTQTNILLPPPVATIDKWAACTGGDIFVTCTTCTGGAGTIRIIYGE